MRILWLLNICPPAVGKALGLECSVREGWITGAAMENSQVMTAVFWRTFASARYTFTVLLSYPAFRHSVTIFLSLSVGARQTFHSTGAVMQGLPPLSMRRKLPSFFPNS